MPSLVGETLLLLLFHPIWRCLCRIILCWLKNYFVLISFSFSLLRIFDLISYTYFWNRWCEGVGCCKTSFSFYPLWQEGKIDGFLVSDSSFMKWLLTLRTELLHNKMSQMPQETVQFFTVQLPWRCHITRRI